MDKNIKVQKILRKIYNIDYSRITLNDDDEFILQSNGLSEFTQMLKKVDTDNGVIVTPTGYKSGLFYSVCNDGELYSSNKLLPEVVAFNLNIFGLKKGFFYRITISGRDTGPVGIITDDRSLRVLTEDKELILEEDLAGYDVNKEVTGIFRATSNEINLLFALGKIVIKDIVIEEVVLDEETHLVVDDTITEEIPDGKEKLELYGIFNLATESDNFNGRYINLTRYSGKGLCLFYDKNNMSYILEKSNIENILNDPFTNMKYILDININKLPNNGVFDNYEIIDVSTNISPNTLKQGYVEFAFIKNGQHVQYLNNAGRLYIKIYSIN